MSLKTCTSNPLHLSHIPAPTHGCLGPARLASHTHTKGAAPAHIQPAAGPASCPRRSHLPLDITLTIAGQGADKTPSLTSPQLYHIKSHIDGKTSEGMDGGRDGRRAGARGVRAWGLRWAWAGPTLKTYGAWGLKAMT